MDQTQYYDYNTSWKQYNSRNHNRNDDYTNRYYDSPQKYDAVSRNYHGYGDMGRRNSCGRNYNRNGAENRDDRRRKIWNDQFDRHPEYSSRYRNMRTPYYGCPEDQEMDYYESNRSRHNNSYERRYENDRSYPDRDYVERNIRNNYTIGSNNARNRDRIVHTPNYTVMYGNTRNYNYGNKHDTDRHYTEDRFRNSNSERRYNRRDYDSRG